MSVSRVLLIADEVSEAEVDDPRHGSAAHVAATLAGLRAHFDVEALLAPEGAGPADRAVGRPARVPALVRGARRDALALAEDRRRLAQAASVADSFRPDVIYERSRYLSTAGLSLAKRLHVPLVLEVNGLLDRDARTMYRSPLEPLGQLLERRKHRGADAIVAVSTGMGRLLLERGARRERLHVVPNSIDPVRVRAEPRTPRPESVVVGWVGHLMPWHVSALELLVQAAPAVIARVPHVCFVIVGGGPGLDALREQVLRCGLDDRFVFTGNVDGDRVAAELENVDVGVIPAVFDYAFPVKLVEMGAAGLPVATPSSRDLDEMLRPGAEYQPFPPGDREALGAALADLLLDASKRDSLGASLLDAVRTRYTWAATGELLRDLIGDLLLRTHGR